MESVIAMLILVMIKSNETINQKLRFSIRQIAFRTGLLLCTYQFNLYLLYLYAFN